MKTGEISNMWNGYCPESFLKGKKVRMRLNQSDFYESEETGLQICVLSGVQAIIMNFRGKGKFRSTPNYADEIENGETLSPQNTNRPPFNDPTIAFSSSSEIEKYINMIEPWTNEQKRSSNLSNTTSGIIDLSKLHELIKRSEPYKVLDTKSKEGKEYKDLTNEIMNSVPEKPGFYLWGKFNDKKFWTNIYLGKAGFGKITSLYQRILEELRDERVFLVGDVMTEELSNECRKIFPDMWDKSYNKVYQRSLKKHGTTHIVWAIFDKKDATDIIKEIEKG